MTTKPTPAAQWKMVPAQHTIEMSIAFAEVWYSKQRAVDDDDMQDAYQALLDAAPTPPAPAEPQAEVAAWMTHHDEPMLFPTREEAACFCDDDEPPIPLYTAPQQPAQGQDPKDAARYRWLRTYPNNFNATVYGPGGGILRRDTYLDAAIDAAMTAQDAAQGGGKNG